MAQRQSMQRSRSRHESFRAVHFATGRHLRYLIGLILAGLAAFRLLPVAPLPQVDFPTISVARLPGASPETMAATVATPLERALGRIAGVTEMTSSSSLGATLITLQFDLDRNIDGRRGPRCSGRDQRRPQPVAHRIAEQPQLPQS